MVLTMACCDDFVGPRRRKERGDLREVWNPSIWATVVGGAWAADRGGGAERLHRLLPDWPVLRKTLRKPHATGIGAVCSLLQNAATTRMLNLALLDLRNRDIAKSPQISTTYCVHPSNAIINSGPRAVPQLIGMALVPVRSTDQALPIGRCARPGQGRRIHCGDAGVCLGAVWPAVPVSPARPFLAVPGPTTAPQSAVGHSPLSRCWWPSRGGSSPDKKPPILEAWLPEDAR